MNIAITSRSKIEDIKYSVLSRDKLKCFNLVKRLVPEWDSIDSYNLN